MSTHHRDRPTRGPLITFIDNSGGGGGASTTAVLLTEEVPTDAVTVYEPVEPLPVLNVVLARPLLSVVALVVLSDTVPSSGLTLKRHCFP